MLIKGNKQDTTIDCDTQSSQSSNICIRKYRGNAFRKINRKRKRNIERESIKLIIALLYLIIFIYIIFPL